MRCYQSVCWVLLLLIGSCNRNQKKEVVTPTLAPIREAIFANGHLEAQTQVVLAAYTDGYVNELLVEEDDIVSGGQILVTEDHDQASIQEQNALENLRYAQKNAADSGPPLLQLEAQRQTAQQKLQTDKTNLDRLERLLQTNSVAKVDVENARLAYETSLNSLRQIEQSIVSTQRSLDQAVANNRSQYEIAKSNVQYDKLVAPAGSYRVLKTYKKPGELVRRGEPLVALGSTSGFVIKLSVDENSIARIQKGQSVLVQLNTRKDSTYKATVQAISPLFDESTQAYPVDAVFVNPPAGLIAGTPLQANIIVAEKDRALLIPKACLSPDSKVIRAEQGDTIAVKTGIVSTDWVDVLSGLKPGEQILKAF
ncbi:HlyD family efflux transporter periplasmic adaptor subunit [Spirosoma sp. SC4-14]|uniref:efflux RND transporter periplasmic adaptor subunit n=1 Tax=Spirosoma sp. SC4-14 TaxID=3128900 RepID=UPI0030D1517A